MGGLQAVQLAQEAHNIGAVLLEALGFQSASLAAAGLLVATAATAAAAAAAAAKPAATAAEFGQCEVLQAVNLAQKAYNGGPVLPHSLINIIIMQGQHRCAAA